MIIDIRRGAVYPFLTLLSGAGTPTKTLGTVITFLTLFAGLFTARWIEKHFFHLRANGFHDIFHMVPTINELKIFQIRRDSRLQRLYLLNS